MTSTTTTNQKPDKKQNPITIKELLDGVRDPEGLSYIDRLVIRMGKNNPKP